MNRKRRTACIFMAAMMGLSAVSFSGCGKSESAPETVTETETEQEVLSDWNYGQVAIGGGGFVTGIISTCESGLFYARTDVGGAYRWDNANSKWISLNYDISEEDRGLLGIGGIAVDPNNAATVYLVAGTSYFSGGKTCIMKSTDYGAHFTRVDVTDKIKVDGNGMGRGNGERIAVDPNNSSIIYAGGGSGGMIRSTDGGETWETVSSFPVDRTSNNNGTNIILFDGSKSADGKTTRIYAGVSRRKEDNLFYSDDAGETWNVLPVVPEEALKWMPQRIDIDSKGRIYVCYGIAEGPWNSMGGSLYRYDLDAGTSEEIPADTFTIGDVVIDPNNDDHIVLVTSEAWKEQPNGAFGDIFYRTLDGGATWEPLEDTIKLTNGGVNWISTEAIHWCSCLAMDSGDPNRIMVNSGNGIFACNNIWDPEPEFFFEAKGIEEVVPEDIVSYKNYPLVTAIGDYDGFVHEDIFTSAERHTRRIGSTSSITIAAQNHDIWAKVGGDDSNMLFCYTTDGGKTWTDITNSPESGKTFYKGKVALNADGSVLLWSPDNSNFAYRTTDWGATWEKVNGIIGTSTYLIGDTVNKDVIYADSGSTFAVSTDGGASFAKKYDTSAKVSRLAVAEGIEGKVYIPAGGMGLIKTDDAGENMGLVPGLKYCGSVGLGAPKNEGDPYVIYVWGTTKESDVMGIYMTEDEGATWTRVNDDLHQFGGPGNGGFVVGDMNVYGRCYMSTVGMGIAYCDKKEK